MGPASGPVGVLGGTFDPIHYGHLRPALELLETLELSEVRFIPCRIPAHRGAPSITAEQRLELVRLAIIGQPGFVADGRELRRAGPSYMVDTLVALRQELGDTPLCLILGSDAFQALTTWHRWQALTDLALPDLVEAARRVRAGEAVEPNAVLADTLIAIAGDTIRSGLTRMRTGSPVAASRTL